MLYCLDLSIRAIGGVLLIGPRGTGKTTAIRGLVDLVPRSHEAYVITAVSLKILKQVASMQFALIVPKSMPWENH